MGSRTAVPWTALLLVLLSLPLDATSIEAPERLAPDQTLLPTPLRCPVDGDTVENRVYGVMWRGRHYYMDGNPCVQMFMADPEEYARRIEPRAALYSTPRVDRTTYSPWVLYVSLFIVAGFVSGAVTSHVAVQKGLGGRRWFLLGLALNVIAIVMVLFCRGQEMLFQTRGLSKIPQTHAPLVCPSCGNNNHPSAIRCNGCDKAMDPKVQSEVVRAS